MSVNLNGDEALTVTDFHTHTFPDAIAARAVESLRQASHTVAFTDGTVGGLVRSMERAEIARSVVLPVATNPAKVPSINDASAALNGRDGLIHFGCMHPDFPGWREEMSRIAAMGLRGIKIHPVYQRVDLDDMRYLRILERAGELGLIVVTHSGEDIGFPGVVHCSPAMAASALRQVGGVTLVLAHMGGWRNWREAVDCLAGGTAYIDTSFSLGRLTPLDGYYPPEECAMLSAEEFTDIVRAFGAERVLFGTDSPWSDQRDSLREFLALPLTAQEKRAILCGNAARLLADC